MTEVKRSITLLLDVEAARKFSEALVQALAGYEEGKVTELNMVVPIAVGSTLENSDITLTHVELNFTDIVNLFTEGNAGFGELDERQATQLRNILYVLPEGVLSADEGEDDE